MLKEIDRKREPTYQFLRDSSICNLDQSSDSICCYKVEKKNMDVITFFSGTMLKKFEMLGENGLQCPVIADAFGRQTDW